MSNRENVQLLFFSSNLLETFTLLMTGSFNGSPFVDLVSGWGLGVN